MKKSLSFLSALLIGSCVMAADAPPGGELIGDPKIIAPLDVAKTRETGLKATAAAEKIGWRIGSQAYTLRDRTMLEALDTLYMLGLNNVEAFPGQSISPQMKNVKFGPGISDEAIALVKKKLEQTGIKITAIGVIAMPEKPMNPAEPKGAKVLDEEGTRKLFEFAKSFGMERIVTEAPEKYFPVLEKFAEEYNVDVALHNHPKTSYYWDPAHVLKAVDGFKRIGSCSDVGHWQRSSVKPIEALKMLEGHVFESHFKDLNEFGKGNAHDLPWGTGTGDAKGMLEECFRQTKAGDIGGTFKKMTFNMEYEIGSGTELVNNMAKCVAWFGEQCEEFGKK